MKEAGVHVSASARFFPDKPLLRWVLIWCAASFLLFYGVDNPFFAVILLLPLAAVAVGLFVYGVLRAWELRHFPIASLGTALLIPVAVFSWPWLAYAAALAHFVQDRSVYDEIISREAAMPGAIADEDLDHRGFQYRVDLSGGVKRIAFVTSPGVTDNWGAVIYDPSGRVAMARGMGTAPPDVLELFGGDLVSCRGLPGDFYTCSFT